MRQIEPIHDAGGRVSSMHVDGAIRRALGFGGVERRSLPFEEAIEQVVRFWGELGERYPEMEIGLITNFPNWDYTEDLHGYVGRFTDKTGITYHQAVSALREKIEAAGGELAFIEVDCPYSYYEKERTHHGDAPRDNPRMLRRLGRWCRQHGIGYHLIVNESAASHKLELNEQQRRTHSQRLRDGTLAYFRRLHRDRIFPDLFHIQSWYAVPDRQLPGTEPLTFTATALDASQLIEQRFPRKPAAVAAAAGAPGRTRTGTTEVERQSSPHEEKEDWIGNVFSK